MVQEEGGEGKEGGGDACEEAKTAIRGGGAREGGVPENGVVYVGEYVVGGDGAGAQAGTVAVAARPVEVTRTGVGQGREVGYASMEAAPAGKRVDVRDAPRDATGAENRKRSNEQMRNDQFNGEGIIGEDVDGVHNRQRQRTEKGSEVGTAQNVRIGQKRGRIERGRGIVSGGEQGARAAIRARVHVGAEGVRGVRPRGWQR